MQADIVSVDSSTEKELVCGKYEMRVMPKRIYHRDFKVKYLEPSILRSARVKKEPVESVLLVPVAHPRKSRKGVRYFYVSSTVYSVEGILLMVEVQWRSGKFGGKRAYFFIADDSTRHPGGLWQKVRANSNLLRARVAILGLLDDADFRSDSQLREATERIFQYAKASNKSYEATPYQRELPYEMKSPKVAWQGGSFKRVRSSSP